MLHNKLAYETSPYLLQHADNPVTWQPWGREALKQAQRENKPIFLSIGYSACHWCHVMEKESFADPDTADLMNRYFINIKVDREEHPDLDELYMHAVVALNGMGGWPLNVFLTPDLRPFFGGTYFPNDRRYGMPTFKEILQAIATLWQEERHKAYKSAEGLTDHLRNILSNRPGAKNRLGRGDSENVIRLLENSFDSEYGGWGPAPKFPSPITLSFLLREFLQTDNPVLLTMVAKTLDAMAYGGIHDHIGGGFHRYSVDAYWRVPHFEKMLYDNAQLASVYVEAWQLTKNELYRMVAIDALDYLIRDMQHPEGGFYSSEDADSEGREGIFYLWRQDEIMNCLGPSFGSLFCTAFTITPSGNFVSHESYHQGKNIIYQDMSTQPFRVHHKEEWTAIRELLRAERAQRVRPAVDDKIIASWNGLAISALAKAGLTFGSAKFCDAAVQAGSFICNTMMENGTLARTWRAGRSRFPGYLDDYAFTANGFIDLYDCTGNEYWLEKSRTLAEHLINNFLDLTGGGFFTTDASYQHALFRIKSFHDSAEPSGNALAAQALLRLSHYYRSHAYRDIAITALSAAIPDSLGASLASLSSLLAAHYSYDSLPEIIFLDDPSAEAIQPFKNVLANVFLPCRIIVWGKQGANPATIPIVSEKGRVNSHAAACICYANTCLPSARTSEEFEKQIAGLGWQR